MGDDEAAKAGSPGQFASIALTRSLQASAPGFMPSRRRNSDPDRRRGQKRDTVLAPAWPELSFEGTRKQQPTSTGWLISPPGSGLVLRGINILSVGRRFRCRPCECGKYRPGFARSRCCDQASAGSVESTLPEAQAQRFGTDAAG